MSNCPNCGAPKCGAVCEYCDTVFHDENEEIIIDVSCEYDTEVIKDFAGNIVATFKNMPDKYLISY